MQIDRPPLVLIAAVARNGVIGREGKMPWHLSADMAHFRHLTAGCPVIMGRRTWDSLPPRFRPLPGRNNIVVTHNATWSADGAIVAPTLEAALARAQQLCQPGQRIFVAGGAQLYAQAMPLVDELELTELHEDAQGDARFPQWDRDQFRETQRIRNAASASNTMAFDFVTYRRSR
jgi:dihydrofolate reductase